MNETLGNSTPLRLRLGSKSEASDGRSRLLRGGRMTKWKGEAASYASHVGELARSSVRALRAALLPVALMFGLGTGGAGAADLYWDANNSGIGIGGTGTWDTSTSSWNTTGNDVAGPFTTWNSATPDNAIFQGTAGTVTLGAPITAGSLTFNVNGYNITGSTLTLGGATPTITAAGSATINSVIAGSAGLTKAGAGTLTLSGVNTFSGSVTVNAGTLGLTGTNSFTGAVNVNGGILFVGSNAALGNATNVVNMAAGTTLSASGSLLGRTVSLSGQANVQGAGAGSAHYTGVGGLTIAAVGSTGSISMSDDTNDFAGPVSFVVNNAAAASFTSVRNIGQASALGAGDTISLQANTGVSALNYTGTGNTSNRNWQITTGGGAPTAFLQNAGTGTLTLTGNISVTGGTTVALGATTADLQALGVISSAAANTFRFIASGSGAITLGNANTFTGAASIEGGVVRAGVLANSGATSSLGAGTAITISGGTVSYTGAGASSNRTLTLGGTSAIRNDGTGALTLSGATSLTGNLTLGGTFTGADNAMSGVISGSGNLISSGNATWALTGANTRTGTVTVNGGTLRAGSASAFGTTTGITTTGGTLDLNGFNMSTTSIAGTGGTLALGSANLALNLGTGVSNTYGGSITGAGGSLTKLGAGTLTLTGTSTYTGTTTLGGGTLALDFSPAGGPTSGIISASSALVMNGGTLTVKGAVGETNVQSFGGLTITTGNNTVSATSGSGGTTTINLGTISRTGGLANFVLPTTGAITTSNSNGALGGWATVNGTDYAKVQGGNIVAFTTADYVNKDNASTWLANEIISDAGGAANTPYFGTVGSTVQIGGLQFTAAGNSTVNVAIGQTLGVDGTIIVAPSVGAANQTITGGSMTGTLGGGVLGVQQNGTGTFTIASTIVDNTGAIGFTKAGTGKVVLSGGNTYTGATTVAQGTLSINSVADAGQASAIGAASTNASNLAIQGAILEYTGGTASTDRGFTIARSGAITSDTISVTNAAASLTFSGQVVSPDGANFIKDGAGTLTLSGSNNSYTGNTMVNGGTLAVTTLANGGVNSSIGASSNASSSLVLQNGGKLDYLGAIATSNRGFTLASAGGIGVSNAATTLTLGGVATGPGSLTKTGPGTLVLSGTNDYSGGTTVSTGILRAGSTSAFGTGAMTVAGGATLDLANNSNSVGALGGSGNVTLGTARLTINGSGTFSGVISGAAAGGVTLGSGAQTFSGCGNTYAGSTILQGNSTLNVGCLANGGQLSDIGASSSASTNLVFNQGALNYTGGNVTTDRGFQLLANIGAIGVANAATTLTFTGQATGGGILRKDGPGTLVLSGNNTYTGGTIVSTGTLRAGSTTAFGTGGTTVNAGATLDLNDLSNTMAGLTGAGNVTLGTATLTINGGGGLSFSGAISGTGNFVKTAAGGQGLAGCNNSYGGTTTISGGSLVVDCLVNGGVNSSIGASSAAASNLVFNGGTLGYVGTGGSTNRQFTLDTAGGGLDASGTGAINFTSTAAITLLGTDTARTLTLGGTNTGNNSLAAQITDNGTGKTALTKTGTGTWVLTNASSTYTGVTTISGGVLAVDKLADGGQASSIGMSAKDASNLVIGSGSTLRYTGTGDTTDRLFTLSTGTSFIESSGSGAIVFSNTGSAAYTGSGNRTLALGGTNTGLNTMGGTIVDGPGGTTTLAKNDSGTWALTGNNTFTGNTVVNNGNLMIGNGGTTGNAGAGNVIVANATSTLSFNRSDPFNFTGTLSGLGNIAQIGTGTTVLTSAGNTIGGTTNVNAGTLQVNGGLTSTGGITVNAGTLQSNGGGAAITTPTIAMNAGSKLIVGGGTIQAAGGTQTLFAGGTGGATINITGGTLLGNGTLGAGGNTVNLTAGSLNTGAAALNLGSGSDTLLLSGFATIAGVGVDGGAGTDSLQVSTTLNRTLDGAQIAGFESLDKQGTATLTLTGNHSYSAGTTVTQGTLQIGNGATAGSLTTPTVVNNGTLAFNLNSAYSFAGAISGTGAVNKLGTGTTTLTGTNSYTGATNVNAGTLLVNGNQAGATGQTSVASGATLGGTGTIGGSVTVADGGTLSPGDAGSVPGALTINGNLALGNSNLNVDFGQANIPGGAFNDLIDIGGNLTLDGTLNVTQSPGGTFGPGVYRIFNYGGSLADNGLNVSDPNYFVQTAVDKQVNLVNSTGLTLSYWDGELGPHSNGAVNGGDGTWRATGDQNWTDATGLFAAPFANASFAIFQGAAGMVTVDNTGGQVQATGMQFATDSYAVQGNSIVLVDDPAQAGLQSIIRVGDGTAAGAAYVATIASDLTGSSQLVKTDLGTLVLAGTNSYSGGTAINGGTLQVSADANLGAAAGGLSLDSGTLNTTASFASARGVTIGAGGGAFDTDNLTNLTLTGTVGGAGALTKEGAGTLILAGTNSYQGGTFINDGTVQITADANLGNATGKITFDGGALYQQGAASIVTGRNATLQAGGGTFQADSALQWEGTVDGAGALTKAGTGALFLGADNSYAGGTTIAGGILLLGTGGTTGSILGDVVDNGTLSFNRSDLYTFNGTISGNGGVTQDGTGNTVLTANNSYAGTTLIVGGGGLYINGDQSAATGLTNVNFGTLGGNGTSGGDVFVDAGGRLAPGGIGATPGTLTIMGGLDLADGSNLDYSFGQAGVVGGAYNDLTVVHGDLTLDGTINVTEAPGGNFGPGIYQVISYDGTLTDNVLDTTSPSHVVQTSVAGQVNLVDISGQTLNFWDGNAGPKSNDVVNGGDGTWRAAGDDNWTGSDGNLNAAFSNGSFAIFAGTSGLVTVDNTNGQVQAAGMQFATSGYVVQGQAIQLVGPQSTIRVGDGTLAGAAYITGLYANLTGAAQLVKTDLGTLVLDGANSYSGGTAINGGTLQVAADANLGDAAGGLSLADGTTLRTTAAFTSARSATLASGTGTFQTDANLTLSGPITGAGGLTKTGAGALSLTGTNSYAGPTTVTAGGLYVDGDNGAATGAVSAASGATIGGKGSIGGDVTVADGATLSPGSADGAPGTLAIGGNLNLSSGSTLNYAFGEAGVAGGALNDLTTVGGNLALDGTLNVSVSAGGTFGPGVYRVFSYDGTLTNNGLVVGAIPSSGYSIQTSIDHQVNLVNTQGLTFNYWDGSAGPKNNGAVNGGDGVWQASAGNDNWTNETGTINAPFADSSFAIFAGQAGTVTADGSLGQVTASGMQFMTNGYVIQGDGIELIGPSSSIVVGDGTAAGAGMTATIASALSGDAQLVKSDLGTLVLTGTNSYTGGTAINGGTLQVSADANLGDAASALDFNGGTLHTTASFATSRAVSLTGSGTVATDAATSLTFDGGLTGAGSLTKAGAGTLLLNGASAYAGPTSVQQGTLAAGAASVLSSASAFTVASGATLDLGGFNQAVASLGNAGSVRLGTAPGTTLTVNGDYTGNGGTIFLNAALDGDASTTDKLVVNGNTSGTGILAVANVGGTGAQTAEGIKIVDVGGTSAGTFTLAGDYVFQGDQAVVGGAYAYRLYQNGVSTPVDGDWYLRSALTTPTGPQGPLYSPAVPIYEAYPGVLQSLNEVGTLQQRVGNRSWTGAAQGADEIGSVPTQSAIWARIEGAHAKQSPQSATTVSDYDVTTWKLETGVDGLIYEDATGILLGGLTFHYGTASSDISSIYGVGSIQATGYGFGGTLTWYGDNGFYTDGQAQVTWYDSDLKSATLGSELAKGNNGFGYALSVEAGQKIALQGRWTLTPQAQLSYSSVRFDGFTDPFDASVSLSRSEALIGRAGLSLDFEDAWTGAQGKASRSHLYGIANLYYDFLDGNDVDVSGTALHEHDQPLWGGLGLGGSLSWDDDRYAVSGEAFAKSSLKDFSDSNSIGAKLGFSLKW
ncbi:autotransporter-associated beta strand repeat-containing protein [Mesorhizobium sp. B292B1B]|uniref:autotransporter-associated beta strand repeat-containing protein n=1 Tax=unclassified Mesorhizobium TaxID=325217 RepID=UPI00112D1547|nr:MULTISPECIES: autotransporter-associated beta strand repeat-containing protein [unclassified Mesorhizobium]MCA0014763.1 autotransporter-associated beta strand repeat-containing protein [Mesorhizobium sp. B294B1A1]MCA0041116.1 autotransporter-associated beta strand repeat-containing protein [Mesorhizobium sp. B292B1B]TPM42689.1 autotransporter outer membrane beta-barrel domain-containing protein [Mesorhizobium sp. B2-3-2]